MTIIDVLDKLGIAGDETIPGKIITLGLPHVAAADEKNLVPSIVRINGALRDANLLGKWRAKSGGTTTERWILVVGR